MAIAPLAVGGLHLVARHGDVGVGVGAALLEVLAVALAVVALAALVMGEAAPPARLSGESDRTEYRNDAGDTASRNLPPGIGVLFREISERDETTLRARCTQRAEQYRL